MTLSNIFSPLSFFKSAFNSNLFSNKDKRNGLNKNTTLKGSKQGQVFLIGGGCGDAELLTMKAHRIIQSADVIMVDWLVNPDLYEYFPKHAKVEFVGKKCGKHSMHQDEICKVMLAHAQAGNTVVRLKGGDPSIFGRLAEETQILTNHNIPFAIIPGITAASGCAAYAGIPLTHRDCAQSVRFVTASLKDKDAEANWRNIANEKDTLVFYMGLSKVAEISQRLIKFGMRETLPIAIIDQGTLAEQLVCCSDLNNIETDMKFYDFKGPALIIVGEVVNKRQQINSVMLQQTQSLITK
ncbi:uroporphyrinogen-III C-methyltransferase [Thalassomonas sp. M1454]|uniref:uroporphyrinogen-III C-methyltransferase n=1 Tax=Thalassomonas sp. M1454 TaxID=2594477 RepID=UPI00117D8D33|nr:uroporphyrinogen-III C-methyltransferase [Thalassomonas sp. M1454]TRX53404.1 uroporphyrinogen-III C-methyltransferase [Thalassomonas sp. M1454]